MELTTHQVNCRAARLARSPSPAEIRFLRIKVGLTQAEAAVLIHIRNVSGWSQYECGKVVMHPAFWELFQIKVRDRVDNLVESSHSRAVNNK